MSDFRSIRLEAVVLRHSDWGEADRLLVLYTRQQGKARAIAKGVRKVTSRKAGHLEPFTHVNLQLSKGRDLLIVTQADTIQAFPQIREDLTLTGMAAYVIELLDRFIPDEEIAVPELFRLLIETLTRLPPGPIPGWRCAITRCACWTSWASGRGCSNAPTAARRSWRRTNSSPSRRAA